MFLFAGISVTCPLISDLDERALEEYQKHHSDVRSKVGREEPPPHIFLRSRDNNAVFWGGDGYYPYFYSGHPYYEAGDSFYLWCYYRRGQYHCARRLYREE
jgi:hypothetical protein